MTNEEITTQIKDLWAGMRGALYILCVEFHKIIGTSAPSSSCTDEEILISIAIAARKMTKEQLIASVPVLIKLSDARTRYGAKAAEIVFSPFF